MNQQVRAGDDVHVRCPAANPNLTLSCDVTGAEPLSVSLRDMCGPQPVVLERGSRRSVRLNVNGDVDVEWLSAEPGVGLHVLAVRRVRGPDVELTVSPATARYLRFRRNDSAPITVHQASLAPSRRWDLPDADAGGEAFLMFAPGYIVPVGYEISGPQSEWVPRNDTGVSVPGLPAGEFKVRSRYGSGMTGPWADFKIRTSDSTVVPLMPEPVGAVEGLVDRYRCRRITRVQAVQDRLHDQQVVRRVIHAVALNSSCQFTIDGLAPGDYELRLLSEETPLVLATSIAAQRLSTVALPSTTPSVHGKIQLNGKPLDQGTLEWTAFGQPTGIRTTVGPGGQFTQSLPGDGEYEVRIVKEGGRMAHLGYSRIVSIEPGQNEFHWSLVGGTVSVRIVGWDRLTPLRLFLGMPAPGGGTSAFDLAPQAGRDSLTLEPLAFGDYWLEARQFETPVRIGERGPTSNRIHLSLTDDDPEHTVALSLNDNQSVLQAIGSDGRPLSGASMRSDLVRVRPASPGLFRLQGISPGTPVVVTASGHVGMCRLAPASGHHDVILAVGQPLAIEFQTPRKLEQVSILVAGAECPLRLIRDVPAGAQITQGGAQVVTIEVAPLSGSFILLEGGSRHELQIPTSRRVAIK